MLFSELPKYVISLPRFHRRHIITERSFANFDFSYFWGCDKLAMTREEVKALQQVWDGPEKQNRARYAAMESHRRLMAYIIEQQHPVTIVCEDDLLIHSTVDEVCQFNLLPDDWEIVFLSGKPKRKLEHITENVYRSPGMFGAQCYAVTQSGAKQLLEALVPINGRAVDHAYDKVLAKGTTYSFYPYPIACDWVIGNVSGRRTNSPGNYKHSIFYQEDSNNE